MTRHICTYVHMYSMWAGSSDWGADRGSESEGMMEVLSLSRRLCEGGQEAGYREAGGGGMFYT